MAESKKRKNGESQVEKIIADISNKIKSGELSANAKLASENLLVEQYHTNVYCVRKALQKLKQTGLIRSVPKFGMFVGKQEITKPHPVHDFNQPQESLSVVNLQSFNKHPLQQISINHAIELAKSNIHAKLDIFYPENHSDCRHYHICETTMGIHPEDIELVDIRTHLPGIFRYPPPELYPEYLPFHYCSAVLIYNEDLLKELGIARPSYRNYKEQTEYFQTAIEQVEKSGFKMPGLSQNFFFTLGGMHLLELSEDLLSGKMDYREFYKKHKDRLLQACGFYRSLKNEFIHDTNRGIVEFSLGNTPFFLGLTSDYQELKGKIKTFQVSGAMMFGPDDRFNIIPVALTINRKISNLVKTVDVLEILQDDPVQEKLAQSGFIPLNPDFHCKLPFKVIIPREKASKVPLFNNIESAGMMSEVFSTILWNAVQEPKKLEQLIKKIFILAQAYINIKQTEKR